MDRRGFLTLCPLAALAARGLAGCGAAAPGGGSPPATGYPPADLDQALALSLPGLQAALAASMGPAEVDAVVAALRIEFAAIGPTVPYVGPASWPLPATLLDGAVALACYRALRARGASVEAAGQVVVDACRLRLRAEPPDQLRAERDAQFSAEMVARMQQGAAYSQQRRYPGDWVYTFVAGEAGRFEWGLDFTRCGLLDLYRAHGAEELLPYECVQDYLACEARGIGFQRTGTLAAGARCCDFRYYLLPA